MQSRAKSSSSFSCGFDLAWSMFCIRRMQYGFAGWRQLGHGHRRLRLWRLFRRLRMQHRVAEPVGEVASAAAFAFGRFGLAVAFAGAGRALDADVEVIVMAVHRPHLLEPVSVAFCLAA